VTSHSTHARGHDGVCYHRDETVASPYSPVEKAWSNGCLRAASGRSGEWFRVSEFNMAGTDDTAGCQHVQHRSFLALLLALHSAQLHVLDQRSDDVHLLFLLDEGNI